MRGRRVRGEQWLRYAVAVGIIAVWCWAQVVAALGAGAYTVPKEFTAIAFVACGALFGPEVIVAVLNAWRHRGGNGRGGVNGDRSSDQA